jgi:phosphoribosylanthranilate isomerase
MLWVKICGMTNVDDAVAAAEAGADAIGLIFAPSKRQVTVAQAKSIVHGLPKTLEKVGVFYDESALQIEDIVAQVGLTAVQLHGDESPEFARTLFRRDGRANRGRMRVFKTLHVTEGMERIARYFLDPSTIDAFLLDTVVQDQVTGETQRGGTGKTFDWQFAAEKLADVRRQARIIVAGGLSPDNVEEAVRMLQPWGVDVCSGVEREPRKKDPTKVKSFIAAAREARN